MANTLSSAQLSQYGQMLDSGRIGEFYDALKGEGYQYAGWAGGVARGDTLTGASALQYLSGSALMGLGSDACKNLSQWQIDGIRQSMAEGYLRTLQDIAKRSGGYVDRDVRLDETRDFHERAFDRNGLGIDNWTLKTPSTSSGKHKAMRQPKNAGRASATPAARAGTRFSKAPGS